MDLIGLLHEHGFNSKKQAATNGGEFSSACPKCGGRDRFRIWPNAGRTGRYWCRQCNVKGDGIQFARDILGKTFLEACEIFDQPIEKSNYYYYSEIKKEDSKFCQVPASSWQDKALVFTLQCHEKLLNDPKILEFIKKSRGFSEEVIKIFHLGYHDKDEWIDRAEWCLPMIVENGKMKKLWLPKGIVIPAFDSQTKKIIKLKIRRTDYKEGDQLPKYYELPGSLSLPVFYGDLLFFEDNNLLEKPIVLVESELDAILIQQFAAKYCACLALGGVSKKPDIKTEQMLLKSPLLLYSLDWDEPGEKAYMLWKIIYGKLLQDWPTPREKSPGDFYKSGGDLEKWIYEGLKRYGFFNTSI